MAVRRFTEKTRKNYIYHVVNFAKFLGRSPDTAMGSFSMGMARRVSGSSFETGDFAIPKVGRSSSDPLNVLAILAPATVRASC
jgi:hypothetical protein